MTRRCGTETKFLTVCLIVVIALIVALYLTGCVAPIRTDLQVATTMPVDVRLGNIEASLIRLTQQQQAGRDWNDTWVVRMAVGGLIALPVLGYWLPKLFWIIAAGVRRKKRTDPLNCLRQP